MLLMVPVTLLYAGILGLGFIAVSLHVIRWRRSQRIALGSGEDPEMLKRARIHANYAEYVPFGLLLLALNEVGGTWTWVLHLAGVLLVFGRVLHFRALSAGHVPTRVRAMLATFAALLVLSVSAILMAIIG